MIQIKFPGIRFVLILLVIAILVVSAYFLAPKQKRLGDDYRLADQKNVEQPVQQKPVEMITKDLQIFYYKNGDSACTTPVSVTFPDLDRRKSFQEITALNTLLTRDVPDGYFSPIILPTTLNVYRVTQGVAYIDLSTFLTLGSGPCSYPARKKQIISTMSQFNEFKDIVLLVDGKKVE